MSNYKQLNQAKDIKESRKKPEKDGEIAGRVGIDDFQGVEAESGQEKLSSKTSANQSG